MVFAWREGARVGVVLRLSAGVALYLAALGLWGYLAPERPVGLAVALGLSLAFAIGVLARDYLVVLAAPVAVAVGYFVQARVEEGVAYPFLEGMYWIVVAVYAVGVLGPTLLGVVVGRRVEPRVRVRLLPVTTGESRDRA